MPITNCATVEPGDVKSNCPGFRVLFSMIWFLSSIFTGSTEVESAELPSRPNIILCMADDQGWGDVGYYKSSPVQTPVLDEMAASALRFDRFYAAAPVCSPTRGSVMTGRHPNRFGCFSWGYSLRPQEETIAEALKKAGYTTGHFGKWHLGSTYADSPVSPGNSGFDVWLSSPNFYENDPLMSLNGKVLQTKGESSLVPVEAALEFMEKAQAQDQPFLAVIWFGSPHLPHQSIEELKALYPDQPEKLQHFLGELTGIDRAMGVLRENLRKMNLAEETLLWYNSDNGVLPVGSAAGLRGRKGDLYEGGIRVPALIEWPGVINEPRIIEQSCSTVDILPTILELAGTELPEVPLDGQSLVPILKGESLQREQPLGFWVYPIKGQTTPSHRLLEEQQAFQNAGDFSDHHPEFETGKLDAPVPLENPPGHAALIDQDWKLHRVPQKAGEFRYELYQLSEDFAEENNVADRFPERVKQMQGKLSDWQTSVINSLNGQDYAAE